MKVETKYDIGKSLFFLNKDKKIKSDVVVSIAIFVSDEHRVSYTMGEIYVGESIYENELFATKEDLLKSLED